MAEFEGTITPTDQPTIDAIAAKRGWQTLVQGLGIDVVVAVALVVATIIPGIETWDDVSRLWPAWLLLLAKSVVQAAASWALRRWADRSGVEPIAAPAVVVGEVVSDDAPPA